MALRRRFVRRFHRAASLLRTPLRSEAGVGAESSCTDASDEDHAKWALEQLEAHDFNSITQYTDTNTDMYTDRIDYI